MSTAELGRTPPPSTFLHPFLTPFTSPSRSLRLRPALYTSWITTPNLPPCSLRLNAYSFLLASSSPLTPPAPPYSLRLHKGQHGGRRRLCAGGLWRARCPFRLEFSCSVFCCFCCPCFDATQWRFADLWKGEESLLIRCICWTDESCVWKRKRQVEISGWFRRREVGGRRRVIGRRVIGRGDREGG